MNQTATLEKPNIDTTVIDPVQAIRKQFKKIGSNIKPAYYLSPINEQEQKTLFLSGEIVEPDFVYRELEYDYDAVTEALAEIEIPDVPGIEQLSAKLEDLKRKHHISLARGQAETVVELSKQIYGTPDQELIEYAHQRLEEILPEVAPKDVPSSVIKKALEDELEKYELHDWQVEFSDKRITTIYPFL